MTSTGNDAPTKDMSGDTVVLEAWPQPPTGRTRADKGGCAWV